MEQIRFAEARARAMGEQTVSTGIGTLSEKLLHRILKLYIEPDEQYHEVPCLGALADVMRDGRITEIQTRSLSRLVPKLRRFLPEVPVTVVYPLPAKKVLRWVDPQSGEISAPRSSPKHCRVYDAYYELYALREFLQHPHFSLRLYFLEVEEYRYLNGYGAARKYRSTRMERIPNAIVSQMDFLRPEDYLSLLPPGLPDRFTAAELGRAISPRFRYAYSGIRILQAAGLLGEGEREGRRIYYSPLTAATDSEDNE